jgi:hypothetical protein
MIKKTIDYDQSLQIDRYNPPKGTDISWHDDGSCTVFTENMADLNKVKHNLHSTKELASKNVNHRSRKLTQKELDKQ